MSLKYWRPGRPILCSLAVFAAACCWQQAGYAGVAAAQGAPAGPATPAAPAASPMPAAPVEVNVSKEEADGLIFERQQVMTQLDKDGEVLGQIVSGEIPPDRLAAVTKSIAQGAHDAAASFRQHVPGGRTKPEAWSNWADFSKRMDDFVRNADVMAQVAQKGDVAAVASTLGDALPCKQCHDLYREPKKS